MRKTLSGVIIAIVAAAGGALLATWATPLAGQAPAAYRAPRTADGMPDLNGIWQANTEANYDLEAHMARPAMALRAGPYGPVPAAAVLALGAVGSVPPGMGVVEGGAIPYKPEALAKKKENQENWLERDPEIKCYLPGVPRATYMPYPFQILQSPSAIFFAYEYAGAVRNIYLKDPGPGAGRFVDGPVGRPAGKATRWSSTSPASTIRPGSIAPATSTASSCTSSSATRAPAPDVISYEATIEDPQDVHAAVEDQHAALPPAREERAADGLQVRRVRRRADVRPVAEEAARPSRAECRGCDSANRRLVTAADAVAIVAPWRSLVDAGAGAGAGAAAAAPAAKRVDSADAGRPSRSAGHLRPRDADAGRAAGRHRRWC